MTLKKIPLLLGAALIGAIVIFKTTPAYTPKPIVAITQIIEHPSLDAERAALLQTLEAHGFKDGENIKIIYQNAQGNIAMASQIASQLLAQKPAVMVAISTPSAQAALAGAQEKKIPLVFTAVSDPMGARLLDSLLAPGTWVTGVSDYLPPPNQLEFIKQLHPNLQTLGIIYNPGEVNSVKAVESFKETCAALGLTCVEVTASKTSDVAPAMQSLVGRVDVVYIPNDNTAVSAMKSITGIAEKARLPLYAGDVGSVMNGAVATLGYDRSDLGHKAGLMVVSLLQGTPLESLKPETQHALHVYINKRAAAHMGVEIPQSISQTAHMVGEGA
jgi:putative ABC transport system substrate-binding protein